MTMNPYSPPQSKNLEAESQVIDSGQLTKELAWLGWALALVVASLVALIPAAKASIDPHVINPAAVIGLLFAGSSLAYLVVLGVLAHRLERSWIVNCFLALFFFPLGFVATYLVTRRRVRLAVRQG